LPCVRNELDEDSLDVLRGARLGQDRITPGTIRAVGIVGERQITGHRQHGNMRRARIAFQASRQFVTVNAGNMEIGQHGVGQQIERAFEGLPAVMRLLDAESRLVQPLCKQQAPFSIVFHDEDERPLG